MLARRGLHNPRVFGSAARGDDTSDSDLDLIVDPSETTSLFDITQAEHELEHAFGVPVQLVTTASLGQRLFERIKDDVKALAPSL